MRVMSYAGNANNAHSGYHYESDFTSVSMLDASVTATSITGASKYGK